MAIFGRKKQQELTIRAYYDRITGLPTHDKLEQAYDSLSNNGEGYAYVIIRAEEYRRVRENLGRETADTLLKEIADLLYDLMQEGEAAARVGGGDFALLIQIASTDAMRERLTDIEEKLEKIEVKCKAGDKTVRFEYQITCRMGALVLGKAGQLVEEAEKLARGAEQMARARQVSCVVFDQTRPSIGDNRSIGLMSELDRALAGGEFEPYIQPQYSFETGKIAGAEILVRWHHPEAGILKPEEFLPLLEFDSRIFELDMFMLEQACKTMEQWIQRELMPVPFSINVSRITLYRSDFVERVISIVSKYSVPEILILFELDESTMFDAPSLVSSVVNRLHKAGFRLLLDNFGAGGFSAMHYVGMLPFDGIKPVREFFRNGEIGEREQIVLRHLLEMAVSLKQTVIFAYVETQEQAQLLKGLGGKYVQGYLFEEPFPIEEFEKKLFEQPPVHEKLLESIRQGAAKTAAKPGQTTRKVMSPPK